MGRKNVIFLLAIILASSVLSGCVFIVSSGKNCKEYHREIQVSEPAEDISELQTTSRNGRINVKGSSVDICDFKATITARTDDMARSKQLAEQTIVQLKRDSGVLRTDVQWPACKSGENISVSFDFELPESVKLNLQTTNGKISASDIKAPVSSKTSNGSISLNAIYADVDAATSNGSIELKDVACEKITAKTSNGSIKCRDISGDLQAETTNGRIDVGYSGGCDLKNDIKMRTRNGSVSVKLPKNYAGDVHASTSTGRVHCDVDMKISRKSKTLIEGNIAGGTAKLDIMTTNGSIHIK